jgi:hypothetical protein
VCNYCGYEFSTGSAQTLTVEEAYADRAMYANPMIGYCSHYDGNDLSDGVVYDNYVYYQNPMGSRFDDRQTKQYNYDSLYSNKRGSYPDFYDEQIIDRYNTNYSNVEHSDSEIVISKNTLLLLAAVSIVFLLIILELILLLS